MSKVISRRTMLRGAGVAIGLPFLEAMLPAQALAQGRPPVRLLFVYSPGGYFMDAWTPKGEGAAYALSPTLAPLERFKSDILVLSGLDSRNGETPPNGHPGACAPWLSSAPINKRDTGGYCTDVSVDQIAARKVGESTRLASLEIGTTDVPTAIHSNNISWRAPGSPMGKEVHPRAVFTRLFGDPKGDKYRKSVLDYAREGAGELRKSLGRADQNKVDEYLESIRSIEKRIQFVEKNNPPPPPKVDWLEAMAEAPSPVAVPMKTKSPPSAPPVKGEAPPVKGPPVKGGPSPQKGGPAIPYGEHLRMLSDLVALGLQADSTRVATFMYGNEDTVPAIPEIGAPDHHGLAHTAVRSKGSRFTAEDEKAFEAHKKVDRYLVEKFAYLLDRLKAVREGEGSLLDHCLILFGSGLSWGGWHARTDLPIVLAGKGGGVVKPGRHVRYPKGTPLPNLFLSMLDGVGVRLDRLADSTGRLANLS